jgi:predicted metalloendopeptidase
MKNYTVAALGAGLISVALATTQAVFPPWGVTLDYVDASVQPGADFFRYSNGGWLKSAVIPPDRRAAGINLELDKGNEAKLRTLLATLIAKPDSALSAEERKLRDFYNAFQDSAAIESAGLGPVRADLERIAALSGGAEVAAFMGAPATRTSGPFAARISIDEKNPDTYVVRLTQSGLGMPDRDYYLREDKDIAATGEAYKKYLADMLAFVGVTDPARAGAVFALEARIADAPGPPRTDAMPTKPQPDDLGRAGRVRAAVSVVGVPGCGRRLGQAPTGERKLDVAEKSAFRNWPRCSPRPRYPCGATT